jgi:hypothetical protein
MITITDDIVVLYYPSTTKEANLPPPHRLSQKHNLRAHQRQQQTRPQKARHKKHPEMQMPRLPTLLRQTNELSHHATLLLDEKSECVYELDLMKSTRPAYSACDFEKPLPFFVKCVTIHHGNCTNISPCLKKFDTKSRYLEMFAFRFLCLLIQSEEEEIWGAA